MARFRAVLNFFSVLLVLIINYYSQTGNLNNQTVGELSERYDNLFTPAGYAFSIWGVIFIGLISYTIYQLNLAFSGRDEMEEHRKTGYWFALVNFGNASWVVAWLYEYTGLSVIIMFMMLTGLIIILIKTNMERYDAPLKTILLVWWPVCIYAGWISVATIANVSAYLSKLGWNGWGLSETTWTLIMVGIAILINLWMIWSRNLREFAVVGIWALVAIYFRHESVESTIASVALTGTFILFVSVFVHGIRNRSSNPFLKLILKED